MLHYTKETYIRLCESYLSFIERSQDKPESFIVSAMRRYAPVSPETELYVRLMLLDNDDRPVLGELLVNIHYAEQGKNFLVDEKGEDADAAARRLSESIRARAANFTAAVEKINARERKDLNRKISKQSQQAAALRKQNRILNHELQQILAQADKKRRQIEGNQQRILELEETIRGLKASAEEDHPRLVGNIHKDPDVLIDHEKSE